MTTISALTKFHIEEIVQQNFENFGTIFTSNLLDALKNIGFHYSTISGISLNIEELQIPFLKSHILKNITIDESKEIEKAWKNGYISNDDKFQNIVNKWDIITESLKDKLIYFYKKFDPTNNLFVMAFSGARGNLSQMRQIVGMRGLMVTQNGSIINTPVFSNFKEGIKTADYIISSYGARKGIVDTAFRTADTGYLTRRLIFLAQDISIRSRKCYSQDSFIITYFLNSIEFILGRTLVAIKTKTIPKINCNLLVTPKILSLLKQNLDNLELLEIRSSFSCFIPNSVCQYCYGWDLSNKKLISLGNTIGVCAAQTIGEPATQLTMRTFHTGGIFMGHKIASNLVSFTGKIFLPRKTIFEPQYLQNGNYFLSAQNNIYMSTINWKNKICKIMLKNIDYLYKPSFQLIKKNDILKEQNIVSDLSLSIFSLKPIYSFLESKYFFSNNLNFYFQSNPKSYNNNDIYLSENNFNPKFFKKFIMLSEGTIFQIFGSIFDFPYQIEIIEKKKKSIKNNFMDIVTLFFPIKKFLKHKAIGKLKIISPVNGFCLQQNDAFFFNFTKKFSFLDVKIVLKNEYFAAFYKLFFNYQYIDSNTILAVLYFFSKKNLNV